MLTTAAIGFTSASMTTFAQTGNILLDEEKVITDIKPTDVIFWTANSAISYSDGYITIPLQLRTEQNFTLYTSEVTFLPPTGLELLEVKAPVSSQILDPVSRKNVDVYSGGVFELTLKANAPFTAEKIKIGAKYLGCTTKICLFPYTETVEAPIFSAGRALLVANATVEDKEDSITVTTEADSIESQLAERIASGALSFSLILILSFFGGVLTNLTPCVYPMIPITIRVLAGQAKSPYLGSSMYGLGILVTYTALGLFAVSTGSLFGSIMASKGFNLGLGLLMIILAMTMIGFGNFAKLQQLGSKLGSGKASLKNAFLMGTGAGLVASPCTGPVLATLLTYAAAKGDYTEAVLLLATYSFGFALPYVLLGGAAAKVSQTKLSPKLQVATKMVFSAVILALGLFYLRIPFYEALKSFEDSWNLLFTSMISVGIFMMIALLLSKNAYQKKNMLLGPTIALAVGIFAFSQSNVFEKEQLKVNWTFNETEAFQVAKTENRPILIDAWAEWCVACKKMEATTFADQKIHDILEDKKFVTLKLDLTDSNDENDALQQKYKIQGLPTLILIPAGGDITKMQVLGGLQTVKTLTPRLKALD